MYRVLPVLRSAKFVGRRPSAARLAAGLLLGLSLLGGCRSRGGGGAATATDEAEAVLSAPASIDVQAAALAAVPPSLLGTVPLPLYDADPAHPWNRLHHALFVHPGRVARASCRQSSRPAASESDSSGCSDRPVPLDPWPTLVEGPAGYGDEPALLAAPSVEHLVEPARLSALLALVAAAEQRAAEKTQHPYAALLFQSDLWERFDALDAAARRPATSLPAGSEAASGLAAERTQKGRLLFLRDTLGRLIRAVALPATTIAQLPSNWAQLSAAFPTLLAGFPGPKWLEVITRSRQLPEPMPSPEKQHTRHAAVAGFRSVFRRYVAVPEAAGGGEWLRRELATEPSSPKLPPGTQLAIVQVPLAVSSEGQLVPWRRTTLIELRTVSAPPDPAAESARPTRLADLSYDVLEGRRPWLAQHDPPQAGLQKLASDALFPLGGTCNPQPFSLNPLRAVCMMCHGRSGEILFGSMTHGPQRTRLLTSSELPTVVVVDEKRQRPEFRALLRQF